MTKTRTARNEEAKAAYKLMEILLGVCDESESGNDIALTALSMAYYVACGAMRVSKKDALELLNDYWDYADMPELLN